jgi:hypothetical protein
MSRIIRDLHPDDLTARLQLGAALVRIREDTGTSRAQVASRIGGVHPSNLGRLERTGIGQSRTCTVGNWARALNHQLTLTPVGFPRPHRWYPYELAPTIRAVHALLDTHNVAAFGGPVGFHVAHVVRDLIGIRVACGVSQAKLADWLGVSEQNISLFETSFKDTILANLQRYARGLAQASRHRAGFLELGLYPAGEQPAPGTPTHAEDQWV